MYFYQDDREIVMRKTGRHSADTKGGIIWQGQY